MSLIIGPYYRGDPRIKPNQWGDFSAVQSALFHNAEKLGIDPESIALAMPMWGPGQQENYGNINGVSVPLGGSATKPNFIKNTILFQDRAYYQSPITYVDIKKDNTIITQLEHTGAVNYEHLVCGEGSNLYNKLWLYHNRYAYAYNGYETSCSVGAITNNPLSGLKNITHRADTSTLKSSLFVDQDRYQISLADHGDQTENTKTLVGIRNNFSYNLSAYVTHLLWFNGSILDDIILKIHDNPFKLWQPVPQKTIFLPSAGAGTSQALIGTASISTAPATAGTATATPTAVLTGTASDGATEAQIKAGGQTIVITLTDDTWVAAGSAFDAQRQNIIDGLNSAQSETLGWNNEVRDKLDVSAIVRTSDTVVTITIG